MSVHRIRIQADRDGDPVTVDVALPSDTPVGDLVPLILGLIDDRIAPDAVICGWRLDRPIGGALQESLSLTDNAVHDGDLLVLVPEGMPPLGLMRFEPCREIAAARSPAPMAGGTLAEVVGVLTAVAAAAALAWTGIASQTPVPLIVVATGACLATAAAFTTERPTALGIAAVTFAATTGFLAVPSGPGAPNALLAATAAFAVSLLVQRVCGYPTPTWAGIAALSALIALATVWPMPVAVVGAVLVTSSLGLLAIAPRIAILTAGLGPEHWTDAMDARGAAGHATLTGLVAGCALGAATGAVLITVAALRHEVSSGGAVAFATLVGSILLLRSRTHAETVRQIILTATGFVVISSAVTVAVVAYPGHAGWLGGALVALALCAGRRPRIHASASRLADRLEYVVLAAVIPVALWVAGAYTLIGEFRLP